MKARGVPLRAALYLALLLAIVFSATQLYSPKAAAGVCCTYGEDCRVYRMMCCQPGINMAACSATQRNYCLSSCPSPPPE